MPRLVCRPHAPRKRAAGASIGRRVRSASLRRAAAGGEAGMRRGGVGCSRAAAQSAAYYSYYLGRRRRRRAWPMLAGAGAVAAAAAGAMSAACAHRPRMSHAGRPGVGPAGARAVAQLPHRRGRPSASCRRRTPKEAQCAAGAGSTEVPLR
eukprot:scaffold2961_cov263-Prasinococcus_capsulatus_cf.AAC.6